MRRAVRAPLAIALIAAPLLFAACGERAHLPNGGTAAGSLPRQTRNPAAESTSTSTAGPGLASLPTLPNGAKPTTTPSPVPSGARDGASTDPVQKAIASAYESYLVDLSGLDDNLSEGYVAPLAAVTTTRLAQATVRQAAAILAAREHGVGTLRDDHVSVVMTGAGSAVFADCQDENDFYLVNDDTSTPDPFIQRGDFAGSAQMVLQAGHWLVDVFTTTHVPCSY
ncbi:MAG TPA: hypothetical protein VG244_09060 [Acidimicrobiales bacterium]|jgi:hypothetical protein|nr:hypothetical protein [Acidimicrobiales bacterium]